MFAFIVLPVILASFIDLTHQARTSWSYADEPSWPGACGTGGQQSPINIVTTAAVADHAGAVIRAPLRFRGYGAVDVSAINNGHTLKWNAVPGGPAPTLSGGPLQGNYTFIQFHLHWLSEHAVDGIKYPLEIHFVHAKTGLSIEEALQKRDGLAVIGVLFKVEKSPDSGLALEELMPMIPGIMNFTENEPTTADIIDLNRILGADRSSFFTYQGSLTTPGCSEAVQWIVLETPRAISDAQFKLISSADVGGQANYRSLQPTNRPVYRSVSASVALAPSLLTILSALYATSPTLVAAAKKTLCGLVNLKKKLLGLRGINCEKLVG